jgi:hypothetical protein
VLSKKPSAASSSSGRRNLLVSLWLGRRNLAVISSTDQQFVDRLKQWAKERGYRVEEPELEES